MSAGGVKPDKQLDQTDKSEVQNVSQKILQESLLNNYDLKNLMPVRQKSVGLSSGKGGVGKTITATNLSIYYAKKGLRVGLIDLDPLSDITTVLDIYESESVFKETVPPDDLCTFTDYVIKVFYNLDLIFPESKLNRNGSKELLQKIYSNFLDELNKNYDILIFDMPAGSNYENNLAFLPFINTLILVTNPEPTAHASAGGYIKNVLDLDPDRTINVWHNRYSAKSESGFNPKDIAANYNKNVTEELRLTPDNISHIIDFAFIPEDPSLNLLRGDPTPIVNIQRSLLDALEFIQEEMMSEISGQLRISDKTFNLIKLFISHHKQIGSIDDYLDQLGQYLAVLLLTNLKKEYKNPGAPEINSAAIGLFTAEEREALYSFLQTVKGDDLRESVIKLISILEDKIQAIEDSGRLFFEGSSISPDKNIDREISCLLINLSRVSDSNNSLKNYGGLLLFYFSLYKLFQSKTIVKFISDFIPKKKNAGGLTIRDRHQQIKNLVEKDQEYGRKYFRLIRRLYPIVSKQISTIVRTFELSNLIFRNSKNEIIKSAYLKLLTNFIHDTIYSGLSVVVGFDYRSAAVAFHQGAEKLLEILPRQ
ncbi:Iron-sulfur cluster carrier protein [subsurface metagenome]